MCYNKLQVDVTIGHIFMKSKKFLQLIIVCFFSLNAFSAIAAGPIASEAKLWAEEKGQLLLDTFQVKDLAKKHSLLDELFLKHVDLPYVSKFIIGKHWREMTPEQQSRYQKLFTRYALGVYKSFPLTFDKPITFSINNADVSKDYTDVWALIDMGGNLANQNQQQPQNFNVMFRLRKQGKEIKIIDIKFAESSLILSYRNRFYQMVAEVEGDIEWFLEDLETTVVSTERTNQQKLQEEQLK